MKPDYTCALQRKMPQSLPAERRRRFSPVRFGKRDLRNCGNFQRFSEQCSQVSLRSRLWPALAVSEFNRKANGWRFCGYTWSLRRLSSRQIGWPVTACLRPEAVALPRNVGCRFPALRSAEVASQRCDGMQLRVREVRLWSQQGKPLRDRCHFFHQTSPCQLRLLSILRQ